MSSSNTPSIVSREVRNFGILDPKGREIGIFLRIVDRGGQYRAYAHQTRDGSTFGGLQPERYFDTIEEAQQYLEERAVSCAKRAKKQFGTK